MRSKVRENIKKILELKGPLHGYEIYKIYQKLFGRISLRLIYYHLHQGVKKGIFKVLRVEEKEGSFSWGDRSRRILYTT